MDTHDININNDVSPTLISGGKEKARVPVVLETYSKQRYKEFSVDDKSATLSSSCFDFGSGGGESIIAYRVTEHE